MAAGATKSRTNPTKRVEPARRVPCGLENAR
jgi:hypothetical protein